MAEGDSKLSGPDSVPVFLNQLMEMKVEGSSTVAQDPEGNEK